MKKFLLLLLVISVVSCNKDKDILTAVTEKDSVRTSSFDTIQIPSFQNADLSAAFEIAPQDIASEKGRSIFSKDGKTLFFFDQNSNSGTIKIDGNDYVLNAYDFSENKYKITGPEVSIEATNGDFPDS